MEMWAAILENKQEYENTLPDMQYKLNELNL
jgi:hypothetical protein